MGPGLLESTYEESLKYELHLAGLKAEQQKTLPVVYKGVKPDCEYLWICNVENKVIIEIKSVEALNDVHLAQILTYLKLSDNKLGYLVNINVKLTKNGIKRIVNKLRD